jgi:hypothetical protein
MTIYESCTEQYGEDALNVVQCVANWIETERNNATATSNTISGTSSDVNLDNFHADMINWLLVLTGSLVFFMQAGFAMVCAGAIRKKNVSNTVSATHTNPICWHVLSVLGFVTDI